MENLRRIEGLTALPPAPAGGRRSRLPRAISTLLIRENVLADADSFRQAGWTFAPSSNSQGYGVYKSSAGRLLVIGNALNVKFLSNASKTDIDQLLKEHHLEKRRSLGFADNLMMVTQAENSGEDPLALSKRLSDHPSVEFVEPVILESFDHRELP